MTDLGLIMLQNVWQPGTNRHLHGKAYSLRPTGSVPPLAQIWLEFLGIRGGSRRLCGARVRRGTLPTGRVYLALPRKECFFSSNGVFWCILSYIFCPCPCQKNVEFSTWSYYLILMDVEYVLLGSSEYSVRVMELVSFYCIVMQAIWSWNFETWQNLGGQFSLASTTPNSGDSSPTPLTCFTALRPRVQCTPICYWHVDATVWTARIVDIARASTPLLFYTSPAYVELYRVPRCQPSDSAHRNVTVSWFIFLTTWAGHRDWRARDSRETTIILARTGSCSWFSGAHQWCSET